MRSKHVLYMCFVHGQGQKRKNFVWSHSHFLLLRPNCVASIWSVGEYFVIKSTGLISSHMVLAERVTWQIITDAICLAPIVSCWLDTEELKIRGDLLHSDLEFQIHSCSKSTCPSHLVFWRPPTHSLKSVYLWSVKHHCGKTFYVKIPSPCLFSKTNNCWLMLIT